MAAPTFTTDLTTISNASTTTGWLNLAGMAPNLDEDNFVEGTTSVGVSASANTLTGITFDLGAATDITGQHIFIWLRTNAPLTASFAAGGVRVRVSTSTAASADFGEWTVGGRDIQWCLEGWRLVVVDTSRPFDFTGGTPPANMTAIRRIGATMLPSGTQMFGNAFNIDIMRRGTKIAISGGTDGDPITLRETFDADMDTSSTVYGIVTKNKAGVFEINGELRIGVETGAGNTVFSSQNELVVFQDQPCALDYLKILSQQGSGTTKVKFGTGTGTGDARVGINGSVLDRINSVHGREYSLSLGASINLVEFFGTTVLRAKRGASFPNAIGHEVISSSFIASGQIDLGQAVARKNTFSGHGLVDTGATTLNVAANAVDTGSITVTVAVAARTYTRSAGSYITDGFAVGMYVTWSGFTNAVNNGKKVITSLTATVMTVATSQTLVAETGDGNERAVVAFGYTRSAGSFLTDGFAAGQSIVVSGFSTSGNNDTRLITTVSATLITVNLDTGMAAETGGGDERIQRSGITGDAALLWNESINVKNSSFLGNTNSAANAAAIQHPSAAGSPYTYDKMTFSGNNFDINNTAAAVDSGSITITVAATAGTLTRSSGDFTSDGFAANMTITASGFTNSGNNFSTKTISTVTATVITVTSNSNLVNETGDGNERVQRNVTINATNGADPGTSKGQPVAILNAVNLTVTVKDKNNVAIQNAQTAIYKTSDNTQLMNEDTDVNGIATESFNFSVNTDIYIRVRKSSAAATKYIPASTTGQITSTGFSVTVILTEDTNA